jgi:hypothetical protein
MLAVITIAALLAAAPVNAVLHWNMQVTSSGAIQFETRYSADTPTGHDSQINGNSFPASALGRTFAGLTHAQLVGAGSDVQFTIARQEGTLSCSGHARGGVAEGDCGFVLDRGFQTALRQRGVTGVSSRQQMEWLFDDADVYGLLDYLKSSGYPVPSAPALVRAFDSGVTVDYARDLAAAGLRAQTLEQLTRAKDHGVTPRYVAALASYGFHGLSLDEAVHLVDHGVRPNYLNGLAQLGYHVTPDQATMLVDHGVTLDYITKLRASGYANVSVSDLVRLSDHGVH